MKRPDDQVIDLVNRSDRVSRCGKLVNRYSRPYFASSSVRSGHPIPFFSLHCTGTARRF